MDQWRCVHIPRSRVFEASNRSFLGMLHAENSVDYDPIAEYPVYRVPADKEDGIFYLFSPPAVQRFRNLMKFWNGASLEHAPDLTVARRIL